MQLVELDNLLISLKMHPEFESFHLMTKPLVLDDYLEIRPEKP